ncbi:hypothetical protein SD208_11150 [Ochrobactrum sp. BD67]
MFTLQDWLNERSIRRGEFVNVHRVYVLVLFKLQPSTLKRHAFATNFHGFSHRFLYGKCSFPYFSVKNGICLNFKTAFARLMNRQPQVLREAVQISKEKPCRSLYLWRAGLGLERCSCVGNNSPTGGFGSQRRTAICIPRKFKLSAIALSINEASFLAK